MLNFDDLIQIPYLPEYTQAGVDFLLEESTRPGQMLGDGDADSLRQRVAAYAAELAFRRVLAASGVPYQLAEVAPFSHPGRVAVSFGGRRVQIICQLVSERRQISQYKRSPADLLEADALAQEEGAGFTDEDLYIFAFLAGLVTRSQQDLKRALEAGQPAALCYPLPPDWASPPRWQPFQALALKAGCDEPLEVTLRGLDQDRAPLACTLRLPPHEQVAVEDAFYSLDHIQASRLPEGALEVSRAAPSAAVLTSRYQWINLWVYGVSPCFAGYLSRGEFERRAARLPKDRRGMPVAHLRPLADLFTRAQNWEQRKRR